MKMTDTLAILKKDLLKVNMPGRYVGGEYGTIIKENTSYSVALCFPDLYEIGMSNQAVKILYDIVNTETEASCERVFNPAPDFEEILTEKKIPLFSLETYSNIKDFDLLAFTIGYELSATNILNILKLSGISIKNDDRKENDPVVIAGGPAATNPVPFGSFIDAVYIGEAEEIFPETVRKLNEMKKKGAGRKEMLEFIHGSEYFWHKGCSKKVKKAVWNNFGEYQNTKNLIMPSIKTVQDHGVVEIMRGCPNGCRFCHAGIFYRPFREKGIDIILQEVDALVNNCGYREITLSSLSSGDYSNISELITILNNRYAEKKISFSFPSMRVNSFTLPLISEISKVRKSGLTFAVETPDLVHQRGLNKEVPADRIIDILNEAKKMGWKKAKFYFMVGLPFFKEKDESDAIIDFLRRVGRETKMQLNVNIGTFIPKAHTPFQWSFQLNEKEAFERIIKIKRALPDRFFKVGFQAPFISFIEGMISRGDERAGELIIRAYEEGAGLDAWEEYMKKEVWRSVFDEAGWDVEKEVCSEKSTDDKLPWDEISLSVGRNFLKREYEKALLGELTDSCSVECAHNCGACSSTDRVKTSGVVDVTKYTAHKTGEEPKKEVKIIFSFTKSKTSIFLSHINIMNIFERAFLRSGLNVKNTKGFNPKPRLEFANPITLGFESDEEIASVEMNVREDKDNSEIENDFLVSMNKNLPEGIKIKKARIIKKLASEETGKKVKSLMASYNGGKYRIEITGDPEDVMKKITGALDSEKGVSYKAYNEQCRIMLEVTRSENGKILNIFKFMKEKAGFEHPFDYINVIRESTYCAVDEADINDKKSYFISYL